MENEPIVYFKNGTMKVFGKIYDNKPDSTCPKIINYNRDRKYVKVPLKHIMMRPLRHPQRYENAWVKTKDKGKMPIICLTAYGDTMRFFIQEGVHRCHVAYDMGYDYVPAMVLPEDKEPEGFKECQTFHGQPRNLFERMRLPSKVVPKTCEHRAKWRVNEKGDFSGPFVCRWCDEFKYRCFRELTGYDAETFDAWSEES